MGTRTTDPGECHVDSCCHGESAHHRPHISADKFRALPPELLCQHRLEHLEGRRREDWPERNRVVRTEEARIERKATAAAVRMARRSSRRVGGNPSEAGRKAAAANSRMTPGASTNRQSGHFQLPANAPATVVLDVRVATLSIRPAEVRHYTALMC